MFFCEFFKDFKNTYFVKLLRTAASELVRCYVYILLFEIHLEGEEEYKKYWRITPECFDKLFGVLKDDITKQIITMRNANTSNLKFAAKKLYNHSFIVLFSWFFLSGNLEFWLDVLEHVLFSSNLI